MNQDKETPAETLKREMFVHLATLRDRCDELVAARYPLGVYNDVPALRSLVGQIDSAARRWRDIS